MSAPAFDEVPFRGRPHAETHPGRLAAVALLRGLSPPAVRDARILELGCGDGRNLIGIAAGLPRATAVGMDVSGRAISTAQATAAAAGLTNVSFEVADLRDPRIPGPPFDYVIAHGLYTWIAEDLRDDLLAAIDRLLAADGVAYVSHDAQPGGSLRAALRDFVVREGSGRAGREAALDLLQRMTQVSPPDKVPVLADEIAGAAALHPDQLAHDLMNPASRAVWLTEIVAHASRHALFYLDDASPRDRAGYVGERWQPIDELSGGDRVRFEQFADLFEWRRFRRSLFARRPADERVDAGRLEELRFLPGVRPGPNASGAQAALHAAVGATHPPPGPGDLRRDLGAASATLARELLIALRRGRVRPHVDPPAVTAVPDRPRTTSLVRYEIAHDLPCTSLLNESVVVRSELVGRLIALADGGRDRRALRSALAGALGRPVDETTLERRLEQLARLRLLEPA